ncbi:outer membrane receptor protein involved in Fe transport [Rheinheimera pacifica]|uniref:TonB-dependent receptor plug domain-containing protein n=1 Tax=Rheinheimera pacifica TaxID=173990 RepID=UPI002866E508|nr:TonB-dependent receptor [Rheinheimera pacifica]MDR6981461.1 outer membrane receptor protein involved in Fe transport [Rheinheimera pacifica]
MYTNNKLSKAVRLALTLSVASASALSFQAFAAENDEVEKVERIEVTGSKIKRIGELAPTPVTVITGDGLVDAGVVNIADLLHKMPNTLVGLSPETTNNTIFASGLNNTNLRGLGSNRTLVLVNGRRFVSGAPGSSAVDLNNIPTAMVERIEISTGGASAVYGSDAIAGVVNIITKKEYDGVSVDVSTTRPTQSGGEEEYASITFGSEVGKANFIANLSWSKQAQISFMDRDYLRDAPIAIQNPDYDSTDPNSPLRTVWGYGQQVLAAYHPATVFTSGGVRYTFSEDGVVRPMQMGQALPPLVGGRVDYIGGEGYSFAENSFMRTPLERINFVTQMNYDINDDHRMTMELNLSRSDAYGESSPAFLQFRVAPTNAMLSPEAQQLVQSAVTTNAAGNPVNPIFGYLASDFGNRQYSQDRTLARIALGFEGVLTDMWSYDIYAATGRVQADTEWYGEMFEDRFYQSIDAVTNANGDVVCRDAVARANGCLPLNIFGRGIYDPAAYDWVSTDAIRRSSITQSVAGATVSGDLFELPAGFIAAAFSAEYRKEMAETLPDPAMRAGLLFNNQSQPLKGSFDVSEVSAEVSIPLLADIAFIKMLTVETAFRYMDYSTSGSDNAWKIGINWEVNDDLRVRLNRAKSVRAPNIGELYNPPGQTFRTLADPCAVSQRGGLNPQYRDQILANCAAQGVPVDFEPSTEWKGSTRPGFIIGNTDLKNEVANDITIGFVYTPSFIDGLGITVDYWKFELDDVINSFTGPDVVKYCYQSSSLNNPYCPLLERDAETFEIVNYFEKPVNSASREVEGVDIETSYRFDTGLGDFNFRLISTYMSKYDTNPTGFAEDLIDDLGEIEYPKWKHRFTTEYSYEDFAAVLSVTHRSSTVSSNDWTPNQNDYNDIPSYTTFDLTARYNVTDDLQVRMGVLNMFDRNPPRLPGAYNNGAAFDVIGQRITAGVNYKF